MQIKNESLDCKTLGKVDTIYHKMKSVRCCMSLDHKMCICDSILLQSKSKFFCKILLMFLHYLCKMIAYSSFICVYLKFIMGMVIVHNGMVIWGLPSLSISTQYHVCLVFFFNIFMWLHIWFYMYDTEIKIESCMSVVSYMWRWHKLITDRSSSY